MDWLWKVDRPKSRWDAAGRHLPWVLILGAVLLFSMAAVPSVIPFRTCVFYRLTGYPCLACGFTRGFCGIGHGDWLQVLQDCPAALLFYVLAALVFSANAAALIVGVRLGRGRVLARGFLPWYAGAVAAMVAANWIYRISMDLT